jgi:hypothetical protein
VVKGLQLQLLTVPPGFNISVYQAGVPKARTISATVVNGSTIVYVGSPGSETKDPVGPVSAVQTVQHHKQNSISTCRPLAAVVT